MGVYTGEDVAGLEDKTLKDETASSVVSDLCAGGKEHRHTGRNGWSEWKACGWFEV